MTLALRRWISVLRTCEGVQMTRRGPGSNRDGSRPFILTVSVVGVLLLVYAAGALALAPLSFDWILLAAGTIILVSRIDIGIPRTPSTVTLSDAFIFISVLLYGTHASVVLAGIDAAFCSIHFKNRRRIIWFNTAAMSLSVFVSSAIVTFIFGNLRELSGDLGKLAMAAGVLAMIHYVVNSGLMSVATALKQGKSLIATWKGSFLWTWMSYLAGAATACLI